MAVLSDSFGGIDVVKDASGIMRRYDNQGPTDNNSVLVLSKSTISSLIELTFNNIQTRTENRTFSLLQPGQPLIAAVGQIQFAGGGVTGWVVPAGVTSISAVCVGGGGGGVNSTSGGSGGAGGDLRYSSFISVTPGETLNITQGAGGAISATAAGAGGSSSIVRASNSAVLLSAAGGGGGRSTSTPNVQNGTSTTIGGTIGGGTGGRAITVTSTTSASGGGGAGGYSGNGGNAGVGLVAGQAGAGGGGGGGGGAGSAGLAGNGGGVGVQGAGANGTAGLAAGAAGAGSGGSGQSYGGGGRGTDSAASALAGGLGAVRIIWGSGRSYPSTTTTNQTTVTFQALILPFFGPEVQSVTVTNIVSFSVGTFVKITDPSINYSTTVDIVESSDGIIRFSAPQAFPTTLSASSRIEGMSPTNYPLSYANTKIQSSTRPYNLLVASDFLAVSQSDPTQQGVKFYNRSIYTEFNTVTQQNNQGKLNPINRIASPEIIRNAGKVDRFKVNFNTIAEVKDARDRKQNKLRFVNRVASPEAIRNSGAVDKFKVKFNTIAEVKDIILTDSILSQDTSQTAFWRAAGSASGILSLRGINFDIQIKIAADPSLKETLGALLPYNQLGLYDNATYTVVNQKNVSRPITDYYIYDLDVLFAEISPNGDLQTFYYTTNLFYTRKIFNVGDFARIVYEKYDIDQVVEVLDSTINSITISTLENFPTNYTGGIILQLATVFVYPKEQVFNEFITKQLPFENISLPRENLFISEYRPVQKNRTVSYFLGRDLVGDTDLDTAHSLELYDTDLRLPPDFSVKVVGENTEVKYLTSLWYQQDLDVITFNTEEITQKILYFKDQETLPFRKGNIVRLYNPDLNYSKLVTILESSNRFIIIDLIEDFPGIGNLFIENLTTSVYPQRFVSVDPGAPPTNSRENLFYFEYLPSLRSPKLPVIFDTVNSKIAVDFFKDYIQTKSVNANLSFNFIEKDSIKILEIKDNRSVSKLSAAVKEVVAAGANLSNALKIENFTSQTTVKPTNNPVSAAEKFYYFNLAPGFRSNRSIQQGTQLFQDSNKQSTETLRSSITVRESISKNFLGSVKSMTTLRPTKTFDIFEQIEEYNNQFDTIISNAFPTNARENFRYFNLAPGFRSNRSIQQGSLFDTLPVTQSFEFLSKFEFQGLTGGPSYQVTGQDQGLTANTVLYYINDLDILSVATRSVDSITIFFNNNSKIVNPYPVGTFVVINRFDVNSGVTFTYIVEVMDSGFNFVKISMLDRWQPDWIFTSITTPYSDFYPTEAVTTTISPVKPREVLRYSQIAPGYKTNNTLQQGFTFESDYNAKFSDILSLEKDFTKLFEVVNELNQTFSLEKALFSLNEIYPNSVNINGRIEISKFGKDFNEFVVVMIPDSKGLILKLRTDRYQDVAAPKKEPVQFWN